MTISAAVKGQPIADGPSPQQIKEQIWARTGLRAAPGRTGMRPTGPGASPTIPRSRWARYQLRGHCPGSVTVMTTMLAAVIGAVAAVMGAMFGAAATLAAGWWARQAGRAEDERASAAEDRARLAGHRAAVAALLAAAYALDARYGDYQPSDRDSVMTEATRLCLAASRVMWPASSPISAQAAEAVYAYARLAFEPPRKLALSAPWLASPPWCLTSFRCALEMFLTAAEVEAGCYRARRPSADHFAMKVAFVAEAAKAQLTVETEIVRS
jgi:hypothetical protein